VACRFASQAPFVILFGNERKKCAK